ncbi:MAG: hypothetical protein SF028_15025 [Candidatus Sumerlaeia bacterium]|nr:hypothetical protein [Candidatus Sumerlaeia bacterium]
MLRTILPLAESPYRLTDLARQRNYTYEESTVLESSARLRELGCGAIERLRPQEARIAESALSAAAADFAALGEAGAELREALRAAVLAILRQAQLAMATDSTEAFSKSLLSFRAPFWVAPGFTGETARTVFEALRDEALAALPGYQGRRFDEYLKVASRFMATVAEVGQVAESIVEEAASAVLARHPAVASRRADLPRLLREELLQCLATSVDAMVPDGDAQVPPFGKRIGSRDRAGLFERREALDMAAALRAAIQRHLQLARGAEFLEHVRVVTEYAALVRDAHARRADILAAVERRASERHAGAAAAMPRLRQWLGEAFDACVAGAVPGGRDEMIAALERASAEIAREKPSADLAGDCFQFLVEESEAALSSLSLIQVQHLLHRASHYFFQTCEVAEKGEAMLNGVVDRLAAEHEAFFGRRLGAKAYVVRDQEQVLYNIALGLVPGAEMTTVGRFQAFGEFLGEHGFSQDMMFRSFALLEEACLANFSPRAQSYFMPMWTQVRRYLETVCAMPAPLKKILGEAAAAVSAKHGPALARFPDAERKVHRDLLALLHTCAVTMVPNGERVLRRGLAHFIESIDDARMEPEMLETSFGGLVEAVRTHLPSPHREWLLPALERGRTMIVAAARLAPALEPAAKEAAQEALRKHPQVAERHTAASRRGAEDMVHFAKRALLGIAPGGAEWAAQGLWRFGSSVVESNYGESFLPDAYSAFHARLTREAKGPGADAFDASMKPMLEALALFSELGAREGSIVASAADDLFAKHPAMLSRYPDCRQKTAEDFRDALRYCVMGGVPGGQWWIRRYARVQMFVFRHSAFDPAVIGDAYDALASQARANLRGPGAAALAQRLELVRNYLVIAAGLGANEARILDDAWERFTKRHNGKVSTERAARDWAADGTRLVLRASALAMLPECALYQHEVGAAVRASAARGPLSPELARDAFESLREAAGAGLAHGPVDQFAAKIRETAAPVGA